MTSNQQSRAYILLAITIVALVLAAPTFFRESLPDWWPAKPIKLGLDLRGGSYLVLSVKTKEAVKGHLVTIATGLKAEMLKRKVAVLRARQSGDRGIEVTLLNEKGGEQLDAFLQKEYGTLHRASSSTDSGNYKVTYELSETAASNIEKDSVTQAIETVRRRVDTYGVAEPTIQRSGEKNIIVQLPGTTSANLEEVRKTIGKVAKLEFRLVADPAKATTDTVEMNTRSGGPVRLEDQALLTGADVDTARVDVDPQTSEVGVNLKLTSIGAKAFDRVTSENVGRQLAIILDGVVQSSPVIRERISGGSASITGSFSKEEAHVLAVVLRAGALPAPLEFEETRTVGASLGQDAIRSGVIASLVGSLIVIGFMILYYRKAGAQAVGCTLLNMLYLLALLSVFGATLTLPGIAGLALTIGMAVDSNVIIFERIREELKKGATMTGAVEAGFHKAHWTILDANLTTLLSGIILYIFGTGPVKGFAVTLSLGIITTVFAALYISKLGFEVLNMKDSQGRLSI